MIKKLFAIIVPFVLILTACGHLQDSEDAARQITKEEWESIYEITNYTMKFTAVSNEKNGNEITINKTVRSTENAMYYYSVQNSQDGTSVEEYFYVIEDGQTFIVNQWNASQNHYDNSWYAYEQEWKPKSMNDALDFGLDIEYEDLSYDKNTKAYTYTMTEDNFIGIFYYYFAEGNLAKVVANVYEEDISQENVVESIEVLFYALGTTTFVVPQHTVETTK